MTTTLTRMHDRRDRALLWGVLASLLLHAVLFVPGIRSVFDSIDLRVMTPPEPTVPPMEFTLVSPPETPTEPDRDSQYRSSVSSAASDNDPRNTDSDLPHSEGRMPVPDQPSKAEGAGGGGKSELPPMPEEQTGLTEALQRSRFTNQMSPRHDAGLPDESPDFDEGGSARASIGGISLSTTAWDFAPYLLDMKRRIKQKWIPPIAFTALGAVHGYTWVRFRIYPDGHLDSAEVIETEGHDSLHRSSVNAVKGAAPFRALPDDFPDKYLEIEFGFYYLLPGDETRFFKDGKYVRKADKDEGSQP